MTAPLRLAIVGCGRIAQAYVQALARVPALRVVAAVDPDVASAQAVARQAGAVPAVPDLAAMAAAGIAADVALVLTPPSTHEALATALLDRGIHVLCEKPLATSSRSAVRMLAAARRAGRVLMMGSKFRYTPDVAAARRLVEAGAIGRVLLYENVFCSRVEMAGRWNADRATAGGGVLIDNGSHAVDIARFLLGPLARVLVQFGAQVQPLDVEDTARVSFETEAGAIGSIDLSWSLHKELPCYVSLHGSEGTIEVGWRESRWRRRGETAWQTFGRGYDKVEAFAAQLEDLVRTVQGRAAPVIGDEDALASVQVIDAAYRSARERAWCSIAAPAPPEAVS